MQDTSNFTGSVLSSIGQFLEQAPGVICWEKDAASVFVNANNNFSRLTGVKSTEQVVGITNYDLPSDISKLAEVVRANDKLVMLKKQPLRFLEVYHGIHDWYVCLVNRIPKYDAAGEVCGTIGIAIDVTKPLTNFGRLLSRKSFPTKNTLAQNSFAIGPDAANIILAPRQLECLFLLLHGKTAKESGRCMGISPRTVDQHLEVLKIKFNCHTRSELISAAIDHGFANIIPERFLTEQFSVMLD